MNWQQIPRAKEKLKKKSASKQHSKTPILIRKKIHKPEWVDNLEDLLVKITRNSPASPSKMQTKTAALLGLNLSGSLKIEVADSWKPTWETTLPALSSMFCSSISSGDGEGGL